MTDILILEKPVLCKWSLYDRSLLHERVKEAVTFFLSMETCMAQIYLLRVSVAVGVMKSASLLVYIYNKKSSKQDLLLMTVNIIH